MRHIFIVTASALTLAACGSGSKGPTRIEYAQRADAICSRYKQETSALRARSGNVRDLARIAERTLVLLDRTTTQLRALPMPRDETKAARAWLDSLRGLRRDVVRIRDAAHDNDLERVRVAAIAAERDDEASNALARRLGLTACSTG